MRSIRISTFAILVLTLTMTAMIAGCPSKDSPSGNGSSTGGGSSGGTAAAPSGIYESQLPDNTTFRMEFLSGGKAKMTMIEKGVEDVNDGSWIVNGESIIVQTPEGLPLSFKWNGSALVAEMGGMALTFTKK